MDKDKKQEKEKPDEILGVRNMAGVTKKPFVTNPGNKVLTR